MFAFVRLIRPLIMVFTVTLMIGGVPAQAQLVSGIGGSVPTLAPMLEKVTPAVVNISVVSRALEWWGEATDALPQQTATPPAGNNSPAAQTGSTAPAGGTAPTDRTAHASGGSGNQNPVNAPSGNTVTKP